MTTYVDIHDEGQARGLAERISDLASDLNDGSVPPEVEWGDDRHGRRMREQYYKVEADGLSLPALALYHRQQIAEAFTEIGTAAQQVIQGIGVQELLNELDLDQVDPSV